MGSLELSVPATEGVHDPQAHDGGDDPNDPDDPYYMDPGLIWWYTENLPNRWRACRTWNDLM